MRRLHFAILVFGAVAVPGLALALEYLEAEERGTVDEESTDIDRARNFVFGHRA